MESQYVAGVAVLEGQTRLERARAIAAAGGLERALASGAVPQYVDTTLSEAIVLGLLRQEVRVFLCVLGHGSTEIGEVLRVCQQAGLVRVCGVRSEIEASHAATALRWVTGEKAAVVTSIGPGALRAILPRDVPRGLFARENPLSGRTESRHAGRAP